MIEAQAFSQLFIASGSKPGSQTAGRGAIICLAVLSGSQSGVCQSGDSQGSLRRFKRFPSHFYQEILHFLFFCRHGFILKDVSCLHVSCTGFYAGKHGTKMQPCQNVCLFICRLAADHSQSEKLEAILQPPQNPLSSECREVPSDLQSKWLIHRR